MDSKISQFPVASSVPAGTYFPVVIDNINKIVTAGVFSLNLPNLGNKGITKNAVSVATLAAIPLTASLVKLSVSVTPSFTLAAGTEGQEIKLVAGDPVGVTTATMSISMGVKSTVTLVFVGGEWMILSKNNCTIT